MDQEIVVRPLSEPDWQTLRALRFAALEDAPDSFGSLLQTALEQPETYWRGWAAGRPSRLQAWLAVHGDAPVGLVSAGIPHEGVGHAGALWVSPDARGHGLGRRLLETACDWIASEGCHRVEFEVTDGNPAEKLYISMGFRRTGASQPLREGSSLVEVTMARDIPFVPPPATPGSA